MTTPATWTAATAAEVLDRSNYAMTVERRESKSGKVTFHHIVTFKGDTFDTRTSGREYAAYALNIEVGGKVAGYRTGADYNRKTAARYRKMAAKGGDQFTPAQYEAWAAQADATAASYAQAADDLEAKGPAYNWQLLGQGTGYTSNPGRARGVVILANNAAR